MSRVVLAPSAAAATRPSLLGRLPNYLTLARIAAIPLLVWLLLWDGVFSNQAAGLLFATAGVTDLFDGLLARRYRTATQLGVFFDLVGDKLLIAAILFAMVELAWMPGWVALTFVAREFFVMGLRAYAGAQGVTVPAGHLGKWKMLWQYTALNALMWERSDFAWALMTIALTFTLISGAHYTVRISRMLRSRPAPEPPDVV